MLYPRRRSRRRRRLLMLQFTFKLSLTYLSNTIDYYLQHSIIGLTYYNNYTTITVPEACPHPQGHALDTKLSPLTHVCV
jgi:hypothetical protein